MSIRLYRSLIGLTILLALYFDIPWLLYLLIGVVLFEGLGNVQVPVLLARLQGQPADYEPESSLAIAFRTRFNFQAERAWRIGVGLVLLIVLSRYEQSLWFLPWFMGFTILGAGASGVCPVYLSLKWIGFR